MSDPATDVKSAADSLIGAVESIGSAPVPNKAPLPDYALRYAPILWLDEHEQYWPGDPLLQLKSMIPRTSDGQVIEVPPELSGTYGMLNLPPVNQYETYLSSLVDPQVDPKNEVLTSTHGKPHASTHRSTSSCWIIAVDKTKIVGPGTMDIFYFYYYPYNLGNTVAGTAFGNHVGDWEHSMVRFQNGTPIAIHLSAHSDGHAWAWNLPEKMGERPVAYAASASHANYPKAGDHDYSDVKLVGPIDHTSKGFLWDPVLNYVAVKYDVDTQTFSALSAATPSTVTSSPSPEPGASPQDNKPVSLTNPSAYNNNYTPEQMVTIVNYVGHWGDNFYQLRNQDKLTVGDRIKAFFALLAGKVTCKQLPLTTLQLKLEELEWAEGPQGPRWKTLNRKGMNQTSDTLLTTLDI